MKPKMKTREICQYIPCGQTEFCNSECYIKRLEDENAALLARVEAAEKERDAAVEERDALKCCGNCECWSPMYQQCKHPDQIVSEAEEYCKPAYCMACELWQVVQR